MRSTWILIVRFIRISLEVGNQKRCVITAIATCLEGVGNTRCERLLPYSVSLLSLHLLYVMVVFIVIERCLHLLIEFQHPLEYLLTLGWKEKLRCVWRRKTFLKITLKWYVTYSYDMLTYQHHNPSQP